MKAYTMLLRQPILKPTVQLVQCLRMFDLVKQQSAENKKTKILMSRTKISYTRRSNCPFYLKCFQNLTKKLHGRILSITNSSPMSRHKTRNGCFHPTKKLSKFILNILGRSHLETEYLRAHRLQIACHPSPLTIQRHNFSHSHSFYDTRWTKPAFEFYDLIR